MAAEEAKSPGKALNFADANRFSTRDEDEAVARGADIPVRNSRVFRESPHGYSTDHT